MAGKRRGRGRAAASDALVDAAAEILETIQPCSVRAVCYKLFTMGVISSMAKNETAKVSRNLVWARENDVIPWEWLVDETREAERPGTWADPEEFARAALRSFRRDRWEGQSVRVEVWSEKGTIRGTLAPILHKYGVTFRVLHGYSSATAAQEIATEATDKALIALYIGDYDPSGLHMSEVDLPFRLIRYGGRHVHLSRVALVEDDLGDLPSFPAKRSDTRFRWFQEFTEGTTAWELDAMDPNDLRERVETEITNCIEPDSWERTGLAEEAEQETLRLVLGSWRGGRSISGPVSESGGVTSGP